MRVSYVTGMDLFKSHMFILEAHDSLREVRSCLALAVDEVTNDIAAAIRCFPNVSATRSSCQGKLPAWGVNVKQVHGAAPVDVISRVFAGPFLAYVI